MRKILLLFFILFLFIPSIHADVLNNSATISQDFSSVTSVNADFAGSQKMCISCDQIYVISLNSVYSYVFDFTQAKRLSKIEQQSNDFSVQAGSYDTQGWKYSSNILLNTGLTNEKFAVFTATINGIYYGSGIIGWKYVGWYKFRYDVTFTYINNSYADTLTGIKEIIFDYDKTIFSSYYAGFTPATCSGNCIYYSGNGNGFRFTGMTDGEVNPANDGKNDISLHYSAGANDIITYTTNINTTYTLYYNLTTNLYNFSDFNVTPSLERRISLSYLSKGTPLEYNSSGYIINGQNLYQVSTTTNIINYSIYYYNITNTLWYLKYIPLINSIYVYKLIDGTYSLPIVNNLYFSQIAGFGQTVYTTFYQGSNIFQNTQIVNFNLSNNSYYVTIQKPDNTYFISQADAQLIQINPSSLSIFIPTTAQTGLYTANLYSRNVSSNISTLLYSSQFTILSTTPPLPNGTSGQISIIPQAYPAMQGMSYYVVYNITQGYSSSNRYLISVYKPDGISVLQAISYLGAVSYTDATGKTVYYIQSSNQTFSTQNYFTNYFDNIGIWNATVSYCTFYQPFCPSNYLSLPFQLPSLIDTAQIGVTFPSTTNFSLTTDKTDYQNGDTITITIVNPSQSTVYLTGLSYQSGYPLPNTIDIPIPPATTVPSITILTRIIDNMPTGNYSYVLYPASGLSGNRLALARWNINIFPDTNKLSIAWDKSIYYIGNTALLKYANNYNTSILSIQKTDLVGNTVSVNTYNIPANESKIIMISMDSLGKWTARLYNVAEPVNYSISSIVTVIPQGFINPTCLEKPNYLCWDKNNYNAGENFTLSYKFTFNESWTGLYHVIIKIIKPDGLPMPTIYGQNQLNLTINVNSPTGTLVGSFNCKYGTGKFTAIAYLENNNGSQSYITSSDANVLGSAQCGNTPTPTPTATPIGETNVCTSTIPQINGWVRLMNFGLNDTTRLGFSLLIIMGFIFIGWSITRSGTIGLAFGFLPYAFFASLSFTDCGVIFMPKWVTIMEGLLIALSFKIFR